MLRVKVNQRRIPRNVDSELRQAMLSILRDTAWEGMVIAKDYCPKDTHSLADSIRVERDGSIFRLIAGGTAEDLGYHGKPMTYGPYVEWGTVYQTAQPFMRPAIDLLNDRIPVRLEELDKTVRGLLSGQTRVRGTFFADFEE